MSMTLSYLQQLKKSLLIQLMNLELSHLQESMETKRKMTHLKSNLLNSSKAQELSLLR